MPLDYENQPTIFSGSSGITNNQTPVTVLSTPTDSVNRLIKNGGLSVINFDTGPIEILLVRSSSLSGQIVDCVILEPGDKWTNFGEIVLNTDQNNLVINLKQPVTTSQATWNVAYFELAV